jgi:hypothetical protein
MLELNLQPITNTSVIKDSSSHESVEIVTLNLQSKKNEFIKPTFEEFKAQRFAEHERRLMFLMEHCSDKFLNCEIKKISNSRSIRLFKEGRLVLELFNHEVFYENVNSDFVDFLQKYIPKEISQPYNELPKTT